MLDNPLRRVHTKSHPIRHNFNLFFAIIQFRRSRKAIIPTGSLRAAMRLQDINIRNSIQDPRPRPERRRWRQCPRHPLRSHVYRPVFETILCHAQSPIHRLATPSCTSPYNTPCRPVIRSGSAAPATSKIRRRGSDNTGLAAIRTDLEARHHSIP